MITALRVAKAYAAAQKGVGGLGAEGPAGAGGADFRPLVKTGVEKAGGSSRG